MSDTRIVECGTCDGGCHLCHGRAEVEAETDFLSEDDWERIEQRVDRRDFLCRHPPKCPECGADQVQLMAYIDVTPAEWRCRVDRRHRFTFEPSI